MNFNFTIIAFAAAMILVSVALTVPVNGWLFVLTAFAGLNPLQAAFTRFCPLASGNT